MLSIGPYNLGLGSLDQALHQLTRSRAAAHQHALLGNIALNLITYFEGMSLRFAADYAEHALIGGKPRLQYTGDKLDEVSWQLVFHSGFCKPEVELLKLRAAVAAHKPLPLVFANGDYKGRFVPVSIDVTSRQTLLNGTPIWIEVQMSLKEHYDPTAQTETAPKKAPTAAESAGPGGLAKLPAATMLRMPVVRAALALICRNAK